jgi:hypothetical protein
MTSVTCHHGKSRDTRGYAAVMSTPVPRLLEVGQDDLFTSLDDVEADYLGTGHSITPGRRTTRDIPQLAPSLLAYTSRLLRGGYDWVVLPVIDRNWPHDPTPMRRHFRRAITAFLYWKPFGAQETLFRRVTPRRTRVCVMDLYDSPAIHDDFADAVGATVYLKRNLTVADRTRYADRDWSLEFLPFWIRESEYPSSSPAKDIDLFYAAQPVSGARKGAEKQLPLLEQAGVKVYAPTERLPFEDFMLAMARSYLTLSPEGYGYHCFRHCEAMFLGSVPVINQPAQAMVTDLEDGLNCLLYRDDQPGALQEVVLKALEDKTRLEALGAELKTYAREHYTMPKVGRAVLGTLR